tara:strand:- start:2190 stop:4031 length:1842 start_codon:yes stop_codon:yes gene_type:complete
MSIYYNLKRSADSNVETPAVFNSDGATGNVVNNQSDYQVGVVRFKIPINSIPQYRVYNNDLKLAFVNTNGIGGIPLINATDSLDLDAANVFGGLDIFNEKQIGHYGLDNLRNNRPFIDIKSQKQFADLMNRGLTKAYTNNSRLFNNDTNRVIIQQGLGVPFLADNTYDNNTNDMFSFSVPALGDNADGTYGHLLISDIELQLEKCFNNNAGTGFDWRNIEIVLSRYEIGFGPRAQVNVDSITGGNFTTAVGNPVDEYVLKGFGGMDGITGLFYDGGGITTLTPRIVIQNNADVNIQDLNNEMLQNAFIGEREIDAPLEMRCYPSDSNNSGYMGKVYDGYNYFLRFKNSTYNNKTGAGGGYPTIFQIQDTLLRIRTMTMPVPASSNLFIESTKNTDWLIPQFKLDGNDNKLYIEIDNKYLKYWKWDIYMNDMLFNLMSFGEFNALKINQNNFSDYVSNPIFSPIYTGRILKLPRNINKRNDGNVKTSIQNRSVQVFKESFNTSFARDFINSIVLITGNIAVSGEIAGNGSSVRRVLTDFELDPSQIDRDYIVYSAAGGGTRYYYLGANTPLRRVDVEVKFEDVNGILRPLFIPANMECSVKLEFRPNNMVLNFE